MMIVGVDCAAQPKNTGLACAIEAKEKILILESCCASNQASAASIVAGWAAKSERALFALDAPLGWPAAMGQSLSRHRAGCPIAPIAHQMFRRMTDDLIYQRLKKRPMEVAADRIARAAHAALCFLEELRELLSFNVQLVWSPTWPGRFGAIEVYPAATRVALGVPPGSGSLAGLETRVTLRERAAPSSEHARDAIVCALSGVKFLAGRAIRPTMRQMKQARREGWIWAPDAGC